jgi:hypothetical protein
LTSSPRPDNGSWGSQEPRIAHFPDYKSGLGDEFLAVAEIAGMKPDPWQQLVVQKAMLIHEGRLATPEVGLCLPRQNGKGGVLEILALGRLFVLESPLTLHSAHLFKTSKEAYLRLRRLIQNSPQLDRKVLRYPATNGDEGVILRNGCRLHYVARSGGSGRGLSGEAVFLDEAMYLSAAVMSALVPTISAKQYGQIVYAGSAVDQTTMADGQTFARVRKRGIAGSDPGLAYFEWSLEYSSPDEIPDDVLKSLDAAKDTNPAVGIRIQPETPARELLILGPRGYGVERLNVGDWPAIDGDDQVFSAEKWAAALDGQSAPLEPLVFALDVSPDRRKASSFDDYLQILNQFSYNGVTYSYGSLAARRNPERLPGGDIASAARSPTSPRRHLVFACMAARSLPSFRRPVPVPADRNGRPGDLFGTCRSSTCSEKPWQGGPTGDLLTRAIQYADLGGNAYFVRAGRQRRPAAAGLDDDRVRVARQRRALGSVR